MIGCHFPESIRLQSAKYITTGVILVKGTLWRAWANLEVTLLYSMISENKTDAVCPSKEFIGVLNKTQFLPNKNATELKEEASKHDKTEKTTSPDTDNSDKKDEPVDIINEEDDEDIFYAHCCSGYSDFLSRHRAL